LESQLLGFPPFPHFVISMACFGNAYPRITVAAKARFREQEPLVRDGDYWPVDFLSIVFERETFIPARLRIRATPVRAPGPAETRPSNFRRAIQVGGRSEYVDGKHVR
jgi:hypothetical protein